MLAKAWSALLVAPEGDAPRQPPPWSSYALPILLFLVTRAATLLLYALRHVPPLTPDSAGYVVVARYIQAHGVLPVQGSLALRQFPGLPFLMVLVDHLFQDMVVSGYVVAWTGSIASVVLFHAMFRSARLTAIYVVFVPSWIATSSLIMSEGCTFLLLLVAMKALQTPRVAVRWPLMLMAGYVLILRNTAVAFVVPLVAVWSLGARPIPKRLLLGDLLALAAPSAIYLAYNHLTIHELAPQLRFAREYLIQRAGTYFPHHLFDWPGHSLLLGLTRPGESVAKKLSIVASFLVVLAAMRGWWRDVRADDDGQRRMARAMVAGIAAHLLFHLCVGGSFGYSSFDRYVSHVNPALVLGLFGRRQLDGRGLAVLTVVGVAFAGLTGVSAPAPP